MELLLIRHAVAEDREDFAKKNLQEDHLRPLTLKGRKKLQKVAIRLRDLIPEVDLIVTSPYVRARQTAEVLSQIYMETKVIEAPELVPQAPPSAFLKWLRAHGRTSKRIIAVGHEPQLSVFASYLISGKNESIIEMKKAGVACLELESFTQIEPECAELKWLLPPKIWVD